ncbi:hypothetical protein ACFWPV_36515 [Streptomyces uncialis]|uniref:hypothetical protein n=1 Tax=Streptomyces uncialis TaxID=1048205 RepID=UPI00365A42FA
MIAAFDAVDWLFCVVGGLSVGLGLLALVAIHASMPDPRRAMTPPPLDRPGHTYHCHCYERPLRVEILEPDGRPPRKPVARARHRRAR